MSLQRCPGLLAHSGIRKMNCNPIVFFAHCGEISGFLVYCQGTPGERGRRGIDGEPGLTVCVF